MQATLTIPAKTPSSIDVASKGQKLPSLLSTFSLVRRGGDLFRAGATSKSPLSTTTLAAASPLATSPSSQSTFVLLDALTLKLRSNLAGVRVGNVSDDRASQVSIDVELEDDEQEQEIEDIQKLLQETVIEGQQVLEERAEQLQSLESQQDLDAALISQLRLENLELSSKLRELESLALDYSNLANQLKSARETIDAQNLLIKEQSLINHDLFLTNDGLKNQLVDAETARDAAKAEILVLEEGLRVLKLESERQREQQASTSNQLEQALLDAAKAREESELLRAQLAQERSIRQTDEEEISEYKSKIASMEDEIKMLKEALEEQKYKESRQGLFAPSVW